MVVLSKSKKICLVGVLYHYFKKNIFKKRPGKRQRRFWVREIFKNRKTQGDYHNLVAEMRLSDPEKYFNYFRMSQEQFQNLLQLVGPLIEKIYFRREPIGPAERLAVTLR